MNLVSVTNHDHDGRQYKVARYEDEKGGSFEMELEMDKEAPKTANPPSSTSSSSTPSSSSTSSSRTE